MEVIALVGPSGTGKSHRALLVAHNNQADAIIDDGLLIKNGKIIAGKTAKREQNKVLAVKRAIFVLPGHAEEVRKAIEETKDLQVATAKVTMDPATHNPIKDAIIIENVDGKYVFKSRIAPSK